MKPDILLELYRASEALMSAHEAAKAAGNDDLARDIAESGKRIAGHIGAVVTQRIAPVAS